MDMQEGSFSYYKIKPTAQKDPTASRECFVFSWISQGASTVVVLYMASLKEC